MEKNCFITHTSVITLVLLPPQVENDGDEDDHKEIIWVDDPMEADRK